MSAFFRSSSFAFGTFFGYLCSIIVLPYSVAQAEIVQTSTLEPIMDRIEKSDENTLVVFDVDEVLVKAEDQILQLSYKKELDKIIADLSQKHSPEKIKDLKSIVFLTYKKSLVDPKIKEVFNLLAKKNIKFIALTATPTGKLGQIESLEDWRIEDLKRFGFDFGHSFPEIPTTTFTNLSCSKNPKQFCTYKGGILFSCSVPKGNVLKAFLTLTNHSFNNIIFIDDLRHNLESVEEFCEEADLTHYGFEYTAAQGSLTPLNQQRAQIQINTLIEKGEWLTDTQTNALLS